MNDLISRQALIEHLRRTIEASSNDGAYNEGFNDGMDFAACFASTLPSAQPERKKGRWIDAVIPNDNGGLPIQVCDRCNTFFPLAYTGGGHSFCPNCGADMRGE